MGARTKLNSAHSLGSVLLASFAGWLTGSWQVLVIATVILVSINLHTGEIRLGKRRDR